MHGPMGCANVDGAGLEAMGWLALSAFTTALEMLEDPYLAILAWRGDDESAATARKAAPGQKRQGAARP